MEKEPTQEHPQSEQTLLSEKLRHEVEALRKPWFKRASTWFQVATLIVALVALSFQRRAYVEELDAQRAESARLVNQYQEQASAVTALELKTELLSSSNEGLALAQASLQQDIQDARADHSKAVEELRQAERKLADANDKREEALQKLEEARQATSAAEWTQIETQRDLDEITTVREALSDDRDELSSQVAEQQAKLAELESAQLAQTELIATLELEAAGIQHRNTAALSDLETLVALIDVLPSTLSPEDREKLQASVGRAEGSLEGRAVEEAFPENDTWIAIRDFGEAAKSSFASIELSEIPSRDMPKGYQEAFRRGTFYNASPFPGAIASFIIQPDRDNGPRRHQAWLAQDESSATVRQKYNELRDTLALNLPPGWKLSANLKQGTTEYTQIFNEDREQVCILAYFIVDGMNNMRTAYTLGYEFLSR